MDPPRDRNEQHTREGLKNCHYLQERIFDFPVLKKYKQNHEKIYYTKVLGIEWLGQK